MGVRREAAVDLAAEVVEIALVETSLQERAGVDARGGMALEVDVIAGVPSLLPLKKWLKPIS